LYTTAKLERFSFDGVRLDGIGFKCDVIVMLRSLLRFSLPLAIYIVSVPVFAQLRTQQNWWMGDGPRGIQFSQPNDSAILVTRPLTSISVSGYGNEGGFVASDPMTGALLFYTDGNVVYDANHELMLNGTGLGGNPSGNQPAAGVRLPGSTTRYLIFTNSATTAAAGQIFMSEVDMTLLGNNFDNPALPAPPLADVVAGTKATAIAGLNNVAEGMIIIPHSNGTDYWLITQERGTTTFNVNLITSAGIQPVTQSVTTAPFGFSAAHLAFHAAVFNPPATQKFPNRIAVAQEEGNQNIILFTYDAGSGAISFETTLVNSGVSGAFTPPAIYDVEFSHEGEYLYASHQGLLIQYDLENFIVAPDTIDVTGMVMSYGLQAGPDSTIYHIYQNASGDLLVGRITNPDLPADSVVYQPQRFGNIDFEATQFPQFLPKTPITISVTFETLGDCQNNAISFFPTVIPGADSLSWKFGDTPPGTSDEWAPTYTYATSGNFTVEVTPFVNGVAGTPYSQPITIRPFDVQLSLVQDTTACSCELNFPKIPPSPDAYPNGQPCNNFTLTANVTGSATSFQWYGPSGLLAGQTTATLTSVDSAGFYYLKAEASGCTAYAGVNIKEYGVDDPRSNIWLFGNNAGINFNPDFNIATGADPIVGKVTSAEGVSVIADRNGQVIVSTNGEQVYNRNGDPAPLVPGGIGGSQFSTQSSLIIPFPGDPTLYYIFLTQDVYPQTFSPGYELRYAIFDLKRGTYGELVPMNPPANSEYSAVLFTKSTERITGNEGWLIAHEYGNNNFRAYPLTPEGIGAPVISSVGSVHSEAVEENAEGYMKLSSQGTLAVALSTPGVSNFVEIFDFIDSTGVVTNFRQVDLQQSSGQVYGIEFSSSGTKMFASTTDPGSIHEFAYDSVTSTYIKKPALPVMSTPSNVGAIEMGPDGVIYVATEGASALGVITPNEDPDLPSSYDPAQFPLASGTTSTLGLPNFMQNIGDGLMTPSIVAVGNCFGSPTLMTGSGTDAIDTLTWSFGDGSGQSGPNLTNVEHTYSAPGTYTVTLEIANRCKGVVAVLTTTVVIYGTPVVQESNITLCNGGTDEQFTAVDPADPDIGTYTFLWNTGETTNVITPTQDGSYTVTVTTANLCVVTGQFNANDNRPQVDLGTDRIVCENSGLATFDAGNVGSTYVWTLATTGSKNVVTDPDDPQRYTMSTQTPGDFSLMVDVVNPFTTCTASDTVVIRINPQVQFAVGTIIPPSACLQSDGSFEFTITTTGSYYYTVTDVLDATMVTGGNETGPSGNILVPNLEAGAYHLEISNQVTGCLDRETVGLSDPSAGFTVEIVQDDFCFPAPPAARRLGIHLESTATLPYDYRILGELTTNIFAEGTSASAATPQVLVPAASFVGEVTAGNGCVVVSDPPEPIKARPQPIIQDANITQCTLPISIALTLDGTGPAATSIAWTGEAIVAGTESTLTVQANPTNGTKSYSVNLQGDPALTCPTDSTFQIAVNADPLPSFSQSDACADEVTLTATPNTPAGQYAYNWEKDGAPVSGASQLFTTTGGLFRVSVQNTNTGCISPFYEDQVDVLGLFTVQLSNPQPCEGVDFTLTATPSPALAGVQYTWFRNNTQIANQTSPTLAVSDDRAGIYKVEISRSNGGSPAVVCTADDEVQVVILPTTPGTLVDNGIICPDPAGDDPSTEVVLDPGDGFQSYQWYKDGDLLEGETNRTYTATDVGEYSVDLVNVYGCSSTDKIVLNDICDPRITGPNAFRPGGFNKEFSLFTFFITDEDFEIFIFNRWGEMVYHSNDRAFKWNGGYKNNSSQPVPPGTYTYLVKFKSSYRPEQGIEEQRGGVVVLR
jgi:large repetitive protein